MEIWREELYKNRLVHHGIKGQEWGKRNGPPYPLDEDDHSASEEKANWEESLSGFLKKYGSNSKKEKKSEYSDDLDKKYEQATWHNKVDSRLNKVANNFNTSKEDLVNEYVKTSDKDKFLNLLSKSGVISDDEKERLSKDENKAELESMRKSIVDQYDEKDRRAQEKAAAKASKGSGSKSKSSSGSGKASSSSNAEETTETEEKDTVEGWETSLYDHLSKLLKKNKWTYEYLVDKILSEEGVDKKDFAELSFYNILKSSGVFSEEELKEIKSDASRLEKIRKKVLSYFKGQQGYKDEIANKNKDSKKKEDKTLAHSGKGHDDNPPGRGSGRYPWGTGKKWEKAKKFVQDSPIYKAKTMSNQDLQSAITRLRQEQEYIRLSSSNITDGRNFVDGMMVRFGTKTVTNFVDALAAKTGVGAAVKFYNEMKKEALPKSKPNKEKTEAEVKVEIEEPKKSKKAKLSEEENNILNKNLQETIDQRIKENKEINEFKESVDNDKIKKTVDEHGKEAERLNKQAKKHSK